MSSLRYLLDGYLFKNCPNLQNT